MAAEEQSPRSRREQTRLVGQNGNYWFAVELDKELKPEQSKEVIFWKTSIALYRGKDGTVRALENRCAHRQLRLSEGKVEGNRLVCTYHGWKYDGCGKCVEISHELGRIKEQPDIRIRSFPVKIKYGFIWIFPGDPALADTVPLPSIPQLEGASPWPFVPIDITIKSHFSMILENVCDFNHAYLHRKLQPFVQPTMDKFWKEDDTIFVRYNTSFASGQLAKVLAEKGGQGLDQITIWYQYPYQGSDIAGKYHHWLFLLPIDERTTRCFFVFLFGPLEIPRLKWKLPERLRKPALEIATRAYIRPLLAEDKWALEEEQLAHEKHSKKPSYEFNPIVRAFQRLTLDKWQQYVRHESARIEGQTQGPHKFAKLGAGLTREDLQVEAAKEVQAMTDRLSDTLEPEEKKSNGSGQAKRTLPGRPQPL